MLNMEWLKHTPETGESTLATLWEDLIQQQKITIASIANLQSQIDKLKEEIKNATVSTN